MNIYEIKQIMIEKAIPSQIFEQFVFPEKETGTPGEKIAFIDQMDKLLTKEQMLSVMQEQGCEKYIHDSAIELLEQLKGKDIKERIEILNSTKMNEQPRSRLNDDGTISIFWWFRGKDDKYICVCPRMSMLSQPTAISITYCGCCSGHVKYRFQNFLETKLRLIEIVSSPLSSSGERYCEHRFEIIKS